MRVAAEPDTCVFAEELEDGLMDLTLLLSDRLERTHPRLLHRFASPDNAELASRVLGDALPVHGELALERRPMRVSCTVSRHKEYERLWFPSWDLRHWLAARGNVADEVTKFLAECLPRRGGEGDLTRPLRQQPFCVLLLDEIEKAAAEVFDLLLQVLGEGRLTDATGRAVSFRHAIGARPMKRAIEAHVLVPLAERLARGEGRRGARVRIRAGDEGLAFDWLEHPSTGGRQT